jgi:hypothetical protein
MDSDYKVPIGFFTPSFGPVLSNQAVVMPAAGGTLLIRTRPDHAHGRIMRLAFYGLDVFHAHPMEFANNVRINTPITSDRAGNLFFGFEVIGPIPIPLESGIAIIGQGGVGSWVSALAASGDFFYKQDGHEFCPGAL